MGLSIASLVVATIIMPLMVVVLILMIWVTWTFSEFNITVDSDHLEWSFRGGFWHKRVALTDIEHAKAVRNRWWYGWGIHLTPRGWLYNVHGLSAVEIVTRNGHRFRIGTEEPEELVAEIEQRRAAPVARR